MISYWVSILKGKILFFPEVVLFAVPGPFTPTCHKEHCPSYVREAKAFKQKGVRPLKPHNISYETFQNKM
jgi:peroxiredoxin